MAAIEVERAIPFMPLYMASISIPVIQAIAVYVTALVVFRGGIGLGRGVVVEDVGPLFLVKRDAGVACP